MENSAQPSFDPSRLTKASAADYSSSASDDDDEYLMPGVNVDDDDFGDHNPRKRRRIGGKSKEKAALGIFGSDSDDDRPGQRWKSKTLRRKGVDFVSTAVQEGQGQDQGEGEGEDTSDGKAGLGNGAASSDDDEDDDDAGLGLGFGNRSKAPAWAGTADGMQHQGAPTLKSPVAAVETTFDGKSVLGRGFVPSSATEPVLKEPEADSTPPARNKPQVSAFGPKGKVNAKSFGARMMAKMGYVNGMGLGKEGQGRNVIIEANLRPQGIGLGAVKEKTERERQEEKRQARLRGDDVVDSDEEEKRRRKAKKKSLGIANGSASSTPRRQKTKYMTAEEVRAAAPGLHIPDAFTPILDMTGPGSKLLTSTSGVMTPNSGVFESSEVVEARKLVRRAHADLLAFTEEWKSLEERKSWLNLELREREQEVEDVRSDFERLQAFSTLVTEQLMQASEWDQVIACLVKAAELGSINPETADVAVAAIHPFLKAGDWDPLEEPGRFASDLKRLRGLFATPGPGSSNGDQELEGGVFLPEYHRRIPADGLAVYAEGIWDQIVNNKDLDLPTQQELLAQFRCDEISREVLVAFDLVVAPLEEQQTEATKLGRALVLVDLGLTGSRAREACAGAFEAQASRYHKPTYARKKLELEAKVDARLKALYHGQLSAAHKAGVAAFSEAVANKVKAGQKAGGAYEFAEIVAAEKKKTLDVFEAEAEALAIHGVAWTDFKPQYQLFEAELDEVSARLRKEEMRRLATRVERWVKSRLGDSVGLEFNKLGSGRGGSGAPETGDKPPAEKDLWDRIWAVFTGVVAEAEGRFAERAKSFDASDDETEVGMWRLRRKSWVGLREKIDEEVMEGNILLKLRENFEDKFRYDEAGVPRIWLPTDDIEGIYTKARESTLTLIPLLSRFRLSETYAPPDLPGFVGPQPRGVEVGDEEDLAPIGGVDEEEGKSLEEEMTVLGEGKRQDLVVRFKKTADGVYVEAKRGAIGGVAQVPWYFYALLLALGWNEFFMVLRNPFLFILLIMMMGGTYVAYTLNLLGPMMQMGNAAVNQGLDIAKHQLREFIANSETARQALAVPASNGTSGNDIDMDRLDSRGKRTAGTRDEEDDEI
ncbi:hypothetical protein CDD83_2452 [Cordyceps sp. RAO-2017]|nr:hypothetical protein CDD83_2452 [Cordyceps sp. RAO-2017]